MRSSQLKWLLIAFLLLVSYTVGVFLRVTKTPIFYGYILVPVLLIMIYVNEYIFKAFKSFVDKLSSTKMLYMGRPLSPREVVSYAVIFQLASYFLVVVIALGTIIVAGYGAIPSWLIIVVFVLLVVFVLVAVLPNLQVAFVASARKTSTEIELPFLLMTFRVLGSTHLTLYDILYAVENSKALRAWSMEVRNARRLATVLGSSLITAISVLAENHPSNIVRDVFRRLLTVAVSLGSVREVAEKAFGQIYAQLQARLEGLTDKLTLINGVLVFVFLFIPVIFVVVTPLYGGSLEMMLLIPLSLFLLFYFVVYAVAASIYPSAFELYPPRLLKHLSMVVFGLVIFVVFFSGLHIVVTRSTALLLLGTAVIPIVISAPVAVYSELWYRRAKVYDRFIRMALDAATISASLGENFITVLERLAPKYGREVEKLVHKVLLAQSSEYLKRELVEKAPSLFHAAFMETLMNSLALGAKPEMVKELASSYEYLLNVYSKLNNTARVQELLIIGIVAMLSWFTGYIRGVFSSYMSIIQEASAGGAWTVNIQNYIRYNPLVYDVLHCSITISLLFLASIVGKMRGGSLVYGFRTALVLLILFNIGLIASTFFAPALTP